MADYEAKFDKFVKVMTQAYNTKPSGLDVLEALAQEVALLQGGELVEVIYWPTYEPIGTFLVHANKQGRRFVLASAAQITAGRTAKTEFVTSSAWLRPFEHWKPPEDSASEVEAIKRRFKELLDEYP